MIHQVTVYDTSGVLATHTGTSLEVTTTGAGVLVIKQDGQITHRIPAGEWTWCSDAAAETLANLPDAHTDPST